MVIMLRLVSAFLQKFLIFDAIFCDGPIPEFRKLISCVIGGFESPLHVVSRTATILYMHITFERMYGQKHMPLEGPNQPKTEIGSK